MLVDCYEPEDLFARVPQAVSRLDPVLSRLDGLLEDDQLYQQVRADFGKRYRFTLVHGRHSTPVEVLLRMLICKHLYQWSRPGKRSSRCMTICCCAGFVASIGPTCPMPPPSFAGSRPCAPKRCIPSMIAWCNWPPRPG